MHGFLLTRQTKDFPTGLYSIAECIHCMEALSNLNDSVIEIIRYDQNPALAGAKRLLKLEIKLSPIKKI